MRYMYKKIMLDIQGTLESAVSMPRAGLHYYVADIKRKKKKKKREREREREREKKKEKKSSNNRGARLVRS